MYSVFMHATPLCFASTPIPKGTVEKQQSVFFLLRVTEEIARSGLVLRCTSTNKSRFKLVVSLCRYADGLCACNEYIAGLLSGSPG